MKEFTGEEVQEKRTKVEKTQKKSAEKTKRQRPANDADTQRGNVQTDIPKEKGLQAWLTRNAVAFCTIFIGFFSVLLLSTFGQAELEEYLLVPYSLISVLFSIPLLLIKSDHWIMPLAGWFGVLSGVFIFLLFLAGINPLHVREGTFFWHLMGVYFLDAVILGVMARKGAVRNRAMIPHWKQRIITWTTRNIVAFCNAVIVFFLTYCLCFYLMAKKETDGNLILLFIVAVLLLLISIPLILSKRGGRIMKGAGWMGVFSSPYIILVINLFGLRRDEAMDFGWRGAMTYLIIYTSVAIVLSFIGSREAKKEMSAS